MTTPGWYHAEGDPQETKRYWDGEMWIGGPTVMPTVASESGDAGASVSAGRRIGARVIDWIFMGLGAGTPLAISAINHIDFALLPDAEDPNFQALLQTELERQLETFSFGPVLAGIAIFFVLWEILWLVGFGASPGKLLLGLRVQHVATGEIGPGWVAAVLRNVLRAAFVMPVLSGLFLLIILGSTVASVIMLFNDEQGRTVVDRLASTVVVNKRSGGH